eukprot:TRINITY_DN21028_c0_g1_i1.p1 TRINITY_DN21028_c0_g1~~TRINITY_DN21028_c0_g1_i1.p1  ORF type:complete len:487 (+),score=50.16 TRINITY_DN21028_c0_g1_i1:243-1703(+)
MRACKLMELSSLICLLWYLLLVLLGHGRADSICIVGSGIGGASAAHFLRKYSSNEIPDLEIHMFEKNPKVGGRMAMANLSGDLFEAGGSILHPKNMHVLLYTEILGLSRKSDEGDESFGIWDGDKFVFKWLEFPLSKTIESFLNKLRLLWRYGTDLFKMQAFVSKLLDKFLRFYDTLESRPVFQTVDEMLEWTELFNYTQHTLEEKLIEAGMSSRLISELITVIMRINYGQDVHISGLAGAVSMCGSGNGLWSVEGGNWQMASGLIDKANVSLHLEEEVVSISFKKTDYELDTSKGKIYKCATVVIATPLDELNISFKPPISIHKRYLQHTHTTFVRGLLNPEYFGLKATATLPDLIGTLEIPTLPFSCISILKKYSKDDNAYKIFSRQKMSDDLLDKMFSFRKDVIQIDWAAYPHYKAPEEFAPLLLDDSNLYYINAFENAASTMETSAVSAENVARLILSRTYSLALHMSRSKGSASYHSKVEL